MKFVATQIPDVKVIQPHRHGDERGHFSETYRQDIFAENGIAEHFVQDNHSCSLAAGTVRGLHFQIPPRAQSKIVAVVEGAILDVAVDLRRNSATFGKHVAVELAADNGLELYVPVGFAHGFMTLKADTGVVYKVSDYYSPEHDRGILWCDPDLGIEWPLSGVAPVLSHRDQNLPMLRDCHDLF